jgi:hypothetical protein
VSHPGPRAFPAGVTCGAGCSNTEGYRCEYRDTTGAECGWFCRNHTVFVQGRASCRRHASTARWLQGKEGALYEAGHLAFVEDRTPNLVGFIVDLLDEEVSAYLMGQFAVHPGAQVFTDVRVRPASIPAGRLEPDAAAYPPGSEGRQVAWERGWGVHSQVGFLTRVVLRVTETEPPVMHMFVSDALVLSRTPDWIANRGRGTDESTDRDSFRRAVIEALARNVTIGTESGPPA